jgi:hypothetical protein
MKQTTSNDGKNAHDAVTIADCLGASLAEALQ